MIKRNFEIETSMSPQELAKEFCGMDSEAQADFFNEMVIATMLWDKPFFYQLHYIVNSQKMTPEALRLMVSIGEYAKGVLSGKNDG